MHALEKEMATHSSILAWRIPGTEEPGGLPSTGSHRVRHNWSDLAAAAAATYPGEGNGNPLQDFCLGNPMDRGAWRANSNLGYNRPSKWLRSLPESENHCLKILSEINLPMVPPNRFSKWPTDWKSVCQMKSLKFKKMQEFPGSPVARIPYFHCQGHVFDPWPGN